MAVIESFESYDQARPFLSWAMGVARNQIGLYLRKRRRDRMVLDNETVACLATAFEETPPEELHRLDLLKDCLKSLEGRAYALCELRYQQDLKPADIASIVGMSANSVAKALQRVRIQLRACVEKRMVLDGARS